MKKVLLVRHGQAVDGKLTKLGEQQAEKTGLFLGRQQPLGVNGIFASDLARAQDTAARIARYFGNMPVRTDPLIRERIDFHDYPAGVPLEQKLKDWDRTLEDRSWKPPYGESSIEAGNKLFAFLQTLPEVHPSERPYVVVSHNGIITDLLRNLLIAKGIDGFVPTSDEIGRLSVDGLPNCSITTLNIEGNRYLLESLGSVRHLESDSLHEGAVVSRRERQ